MQEKYVQPTGEAMILASGYPNGADVNGSGGSKLSILERFMMIQALVDPPQLQNASSGYASGVPLLNSTASPHSRPTVEFSEANNVG